MRRLFRFLLFITLVAIAMLLAARLLGEARPVSQLANVMSEADGTPCDHPCLFGVKPGETRLEEAVLMLHTHPLTYDATWQDDHTLQLTGPEAYIVFSITTNNLVDSISFTDNLNDSGIPIAGSLVDSIVLGELILAFGTPNVGLPSSDYFVVGFPDAGIMSAVARPYDRKGYVRADNPISILMVSELRECPSPIKFEVHPWMGFTTLQRYFNDRRGFGYSQRFSGVSLPPYAFCKK